MIKILTTTAIVAACASAALSATATAAPRGTTWFECTGGWQPHPCVDGSSIGGRGYRVVIKLPPPKPTPVPEVAKFEIHPEGNGSVSGGGGGGGGGGGR